MEKICKLRPDYETYVQNLRINQKENKEEQSQITKEMESLDKSKQKKISKQNKK